MNSGVSVLSGAGSKPWTPGHLKLQVPEVRCQRSFAGSGVVLDTWTPEPFFYARTRVRDARAHRRDKKKIRSGVWCPKPARSSGKTRCRTTGHQLRAGVRCPKPGRGDFNCYEVDNDARRNENDGTGRHDGPRLDDRSEVLCRGLLRRVPAIREGAAHFRIRDGRRGDELAMYVRCVVEEFGGPLRAIADHFEADY